VSATYSDVYGPCDDVRLDYTVITHFHPDHMGIMTGDEPRSLFGDASIPYGLAVIHSIDARAIGGLSGVASQIGALLVGST
jgi:hypothetical protein